MLTELKIGNFKAFGPTQRIPIKPLTLIFGANSSGKSSIIHALLLAHHLWQQGEADARTLAGVAESVDLGGFDQFVHTGRQSSIVRISMSHTVRSNADAVMHRALGGNRLKAEFQLERVEEGGAGPGKVTSALTILDPNEVPVWRIRSDKSRPDETLVWNLMQRLEPKLEAIEKLPGAISMMMERGDYDEGSQGMLREVATGAPSVKDWMVREALAPVPGQASRLLGVARETAEEEEDDRTKSWYDIRRFVSGVSELFSTSVRYLGPLRYRPPRTMLEPDPRSPAWRDGGGSEYWQLQNDHNLRSGANQILKRLSTGYQLEVINWSSPQKPGTHRTELVLEDRSGRTLSFNDVGTGISQIIPVLVQAAALHNHLICIEQPEIHLHPALQAELGDVFIESALGPNQNTFLLETHSEHLLLRIMRRIRETTQGRLPAGAVPITPEDVSVVFVEPGPEGSMVREMPLNSRGELVKSWPGGFFEEGFREIFA